MRRNHKSLSPGIFSQLKCSKIPRPLRGAMQIKRKIGVQVNLTPIFLFICGERGIRTPGTSQYNGFQDRRNRPLCHLSKSGAKILLNFESQNILVTFLQKNRQLLLAILFRFFSLHTTNLHHLLCYTGYRNT